MEGKRQVKNRIGEKWNSNEGYEMEIIEYFGTYDCTIKFNEGTIVSGLKYSAVKSGEVKNPNHKSIHNIGFLGQGLYTSRDIILKRLKNYTAWINLIGRCYNERLKENLPTYKDVTVCEEWHNFQVFAEWFEENYNPETMEGWHLDKDILFKGNKIYSPETCTFVPMEINKLFIRCQNCRGELPIGVYKFKNKFKAQININGKRAGLGIFKTSEEAFQVYKTAKEEYIKEIANKWRGQITEEVYNTLYKYQVEITD